MSRFEGKLCLRTKKCSVSLDNKWKKKTLRNETRALLSPGVKSSRTASMKRRLGFCLNQ